MNAPTSSEFDLTIARLIKAPKSAVWDAWTIPARFEQWWIPAPARCRVAAMDLRPGGALTTQMSENGGAFTPHLDGCYLEIVEGERIVFTNSLTSGWRPAVNPFMTAIISFADHPEGTDYAAYVMHRNAADRDMHVELGFYDGWGTVIEQLAKLVE